MAKGERTGRPSTVAYVEVREQNGQRIRDNRKVSSDETVSVME